MTNITPNELLRSTMKIGNIQPVSNNLPKTVKPKKPIFKVLFSIFIAILICVLIFTGLVFFKVINFSDRSNSNLSSNTINNTGSSQSSSSDSSEKSDQNSNSQNNENRIIFPSFFDNSANNSKSASSSKKTQINSNKSIAPIFNVALVPVKKEELKKTVLNGKDCFGYTPIVNGLVNYKKSDNEYMIIGHKKLTATPIENSMFDRALNYLTGRITAMADSNSDLGGDFLQFVRSSCVSVNHTKIKDLNITSELKIKGSDNTRAQIELQSINTFPDIGLSIYGLRGEYIIYIQKTYQYNSFFTTEEKEKCLKNGVPDKVCITNILNEGNKLENFEKDAVSAISLFALE